MSQKDQRGISIAAPTSFKNPTSARLARYDDDHRGPAVADAYELSRCRIDLAERSRFWPMPDSLPPRMVEFAKRVPEDQRSDWLRNQANSEQADQLIASAMRTGELPIWVAPIGEQDRLIAPSALVEVDSPTLISGVYRPPNDRGWLFGRPLFVKCDDWCSFVSKIQGKMGQIPMEGDPAKRSGASPLSEKVREFDEAKPEWIELWRGPFHFRATYDKGQFGPGHTLERINQYAQDGATGGGRHDPIYTVRLDPGDGATVIEWLIGLPGKTPPFQTNRYYQGGIGRGLYEKLRDDASFRDQYLAHIPNDQRERAVGAYACAISIREWAVREFFNAVHAGYCEIWARIGNRVSPFRRVPADIFLAYKISRWGYGAPGGARAELEDAEPLYSIWVSATSTSHLASEIDEQNRRMTHEDAVQWCRDWIEGGCGNGMDKAWATFKNLPNTKGCARDTFFRPAWNEAKTTRPNLD